MGKGGIFEDNAKLKVETRADMPRLTPTDTMLTGPTPDGNYHIGFLRDVVTVYSQSMKLLPSSEENSDSDQAIFTFTEEDTEPHKELIGQAIMAENVVEGLLAMLLRIKIRRDGEGSARALLEDAIATVTGNA